MHCITSISQGIQVQRLVGIIINLISCWLLVASCERMQMWRNVRKMSNFFFYLGCLPVHVSIFLPWSSENGKMKTKWMTKGREKKNDSICVFLSWQDRKSDWKSNVLRDGRFFFYINDGNFLFFFTFKYNWNLNSRYLNHIQDYWTNSILVW